MASEDTPTIMTSEEASSEVTVVTMGNKKTPNEFEEPSDACADQSEDTPTIMTSEEASSKAMIMTMPMASEKNPTEEPSGAGTDQKVFKAIGRCYKLMREHRTGPHTSDSLSYGQGFMWVRFSLV